MTETAAAVLDAPPTTETLTEIALVDLSSIVFPIWSVSGTQADPDWTSQQAIDRVRSLTREHPKAAICCDSGKSFRHEVAPDYKATRTRSDNAAAMFHQIDIVKERLASEGYPIWSVKGFEADDVIATAASTLKAIDGMTVLVISEDKDLFALVGPRVRQYRPKANLYFDEAAVLDKMGVRPDQMRDYLALCGDASDNIKGADGIGAKKAAAILAKFQTLEGALLMLDADDSGLTKNFQPATRKALEEFRPRMSTVLQLVSLRTDVPLPLAELDNDRTATVQPMEAEAMPVKVTEAPAPPMAQPEAKPEPQPSQALVVRDAEIVTGPISFEQQLEPRNIPQAITIANHMFAAKMFNGYGSAQAVLSTIMAGRELGMNAIASLRAFHLIEGKHALAADAMRALVLKSGQAKYFRAVERTAEICTFETWRHGEPDPTRLSYTVAEGRLAFGFIAGLGEKELAALEGKWSRSGWGKHTPDMLAARASSKLCRLVYADILFGLYAPEELRD